MAETRVTMPDGSVAVFPEGMGDDAIVAALQSPKAAAVPGGSPMSWGDWGRAAMTTGVRGVGGLVEGLTDPLRPLRTLVSPELERLESQERTGATVPPPGEIANRAGTAVFNATGVPEYQPTTPLGRVGMAAAQGGVGGGALGAGGALLRTGAALAPMAAGGLLNAGLGAASGAAGQGAYEATGSERAGVLGSLAPGGALSAAGVRAGTRMTPELEAAGVNPTFGQAMGGSLNRFEQGLGSIPWLGDFIKTGRAGALEEFNRGAINTKVLAPLGETLDPATPSGRPAIAEAVDKVGSRYDAITPQLNVTLDQKFGTGITDIFRKATMLSRDHQQQFGNTFRTEVMDRLAGSNLTGEAFRDAESTLGQIAQNFRSSSVASERQYGSLILDLQTELRDLQKRSNPGYAAELRDIHTGYSALTRIEKAATKPNAGIGGVLEYGNYTPGALQAATREMDPTLRHRAFARGDALLQSYAESARKLLGDTVPDSGTPYRSLAALGVGAAGTGALFNPMTMAGLIGGGTGLGLMYSPRGREAMNYFLRRPGQSAVTGLLATPGQ